MPALREWAQAVVGTPYVHGGRDRDGWDCWATVRACYRDVFHVELPAYTYPERDWPAIASCVDQERPAWQPVPLGAEQPGDVLLLRLRGLPLHVGLVLGGCDMLHAVRGLGVCVERYTGGAWRHRILGAYRHAALAEAVGV